MRSRLEAKCAAYLDNVFGRGSWRYEPRCFASQQGQYLPDFEVTANKNGPLEFPYFVEVKPPSISAVDAFVAVDKMMLIWCSEPDAILHLIIMGSDEQPIVMFFGTHHCECDDHAPCGGGPLWHVGALYGDGESQDLLPMPRDEELMTELLHVHYDEIDE